MRPTDHARIREMLQAARFTGLDAEQSRQVGAHLAGCDACREFAGQLAGLDAALGRSLHAYLDPLPGPQTRPEEIMRQIQRRERRSGLSPAVGFATVLALAALAAGLVWVLQRALPDRVSPPAVGAATASVIPTAVQATVTQAATRTPGPSSEEGIGPVQPESGGPLAAYMSVEDGNTEIFLHTAGGAEPVNLTRDPAEDSQPVWAPDGERIAFYSDRTGRREIFLTGVSGGFTRRLTSTPPGEDWLGPPAWSPDGVSLLAIHLLGVSERSEGRLIYESAELARIQADGSGYQPLLAEPIDYQPTGNYRWSPGGSRVAFTSVRLEDGPETERYREELYIVRADGAGSLEPVDVVQGRIHGLAWSPDGERLAYLVQGPYRLDEQGEYGPAPEAETRLRIHTLGSSEPQEVVGAGFGGLPAYLLDWSPDGERLALAVDAEGSDCWAPAWVYPAGSGMQWYPGVCWDYEAGPPQWTAGGEHLLVPVALDDPAGEAAVWAVPAWSREEGPHEVARLQAATPGSGTSWVAIRPGIRLESGPDRLSEDRAGALIRAALLNEKPDLDPQFDLPLVEIPEEALWEALGARVFRVTSGVFENETFLIRGDRVVQLGTAVGGRGVTSLRVTDLDADGAPELVYAFSFGSGIQQTRLGMYAPEIDPQGTFTTEKGYRGELVLSGEDLTSAVVRVAQPQPGRMVIDAQVVLGELRIEREGESARLVLDLDGDLPPEVAGAVIGAP